MTVTVYRSTDTGAPTLSGTAGALITVLDAILVNGYNSNNPAGAGWTKAFSATNKATYRMSAVDGTGFYLSVDDTGTGNTAKEAFMTGFEVVTAQGTGTGQFPTGAQLALGSAPSGAVVCRKSTTADGTARAWTCVADDTCFYFFAETGDQTSPTITYPFVFGDIFSYKSSDAYRCIIIGRNGANASDSQKDALAALLATGTSTFLSNTISGHFMPRTWTAVGGSIAVGHHTDQVKFSSNVAFNGTTTGTSGVTNPQGNGVCMGCMSNGSPNSFPYPNGPDGGLYMAPIWIHHSNAVRGYLKGLWAPMHDRPLNHNDTFSGTGTLSGKSFLAQSILGNANGNPNPVPAQIFIETSSTWS